MARLTKEKYLARKEKIITEGMHLFMEKGFNGTGIKDITDACGIPKGSFFNYFSTKESYACEVIQFASEYMCGIYEQLLKDGKKSPVKRVKALYTFRKDLLINKFQYKKGCLLNAMSQEMSEHSEQIAEITKEGLEMIYAQIELVLREAKSKGEIDKKRNTKNLAIFIENSYRGAMVVSKSLKNDSALNTFMKFLDKELLH